MNTINGFDLLLVIIITLLGFRVYNLNRECESYVGQILRLSWDLSAEYDRNNPPFGTPDPRDNLCVYCVDLEQKITGDECICPPF